MEFEIFVEGANHAALAEELLAIRGEETDFQISGAYTVANKTLIELTDGVETGRTEMPVRLPDPTQQLVIVRLPDDTAPEMVAKLKAAIEAHDHTKPSAKQVARDIQQTRQADLLARITGEIDYFAAVPEADLRDGTAMRRVANVLRDMLATIALMKG